MKIAFVQQPISSLSFKNIDSSLEIWIYEMARRIAKYHEVVVFARKNKSDKAFELHEGVRYKRIQTNILDKLFSSSFKQLNRLFQRIFLKLKIPLFV